MKLRHPALIRFVAFVAALVIRGWMSTLRVRIVCRDGKVHPTDPRKERCIYAFWHETLLAPTVRKARVRILISTHADGELIAQVCRFLGLGVVRGSATRGGALALHQLIDGDERSHLVITPDGPRGPRRQLKVGIVYLASRTGLPIVPIGVGYSKAWRARSWDRFALPRPFSAMYGVIGPAVHVPPGLDRDGLEHYRRLVEDTCLSATADAERWAARSGAAGEERSSEPRKACA
jgi:lysophospholipid acyltransferase (LPLAT)-like uncharacterized protein